MTVEVGTYISELNSSYPAAGDAKSEGDDHIRKLKATLLAQYPNFTAVAITATCADLNAVVGAGSTGAASFRVATQSTADSSTKAASTALVDAKIAAAVFSSSLPSQTGNAGKYITTDGTTASWGALAIKTINGAAMTGSGDVTLATLAANTFTAAQSAPSFIPTSATVPTNGMYFPSANTLGWSTNSANRLTLSATGDLTATGNVTAYSDERLKTNWRSLPPDFILKLSAVKAGIYDRTDQESTQVGVSAQSLQSVMPDAVLTDADGMLSVAYGQAALTACVMLAREVAALKLAFLES